MDEHARRNADIARHEAILRASPDIFVIRDAADRITYLSPSAERILGLGIDELHDLGDDVFHPDDLDAVVRLRAAVRDRPAQTQRARVRVRVPPLGSVRWVDLIATNLLDDPAVGGLLVCMRDVTNEVEAELLLAHTERRYQALVEHARDVVVVVDDELRISYITPSARDMLGYDPAALQGVDALSMVHPDDHAPTVERMGRLLEAGGTDRVLARARRASGEWAWLEILGSDMRERPAVDGIVLNIRDVTDRVRSEQGARRLTEVLGAANDLVTITDRDLRLLYVNAAAREVFDLPDDEHELRRVDPARLLPARTAQRFADEVLPALRQAGSWTGELDHERDGEHIPMWSTFLAHRDESGHVQFISGISRDMRERKAFEAELAHQATHDSLTGLPNRQAMVDAIEQALVTETADRAAVFFLDLDEFKVVNDTLGHEQGDALLGAVAERLTHVVRPHDVVARLGGDEFVVLCCDLSGPGGARTVAERIVRGLDDTYRVDHHELRSSVSVGVAMLTGSPQTAASLLRDADMAMYQAKAGGRSRYAMFDESLRAETIARHEIERDLRRAVEQEQLVLLYQPIRRTTSGDIAGFEALVRWRHPTRGLLAPEEFVGLAEQRGLIVSVGHWILDRALRDLRTWNHLSPRPVGVSINISGRQLHDPSLVASLGDALARHGLDPSLVTLEITESVVMEDVATSTARFAALKELGIRLTVDDFGTGYSSLAYLRRFPVDGLKVDREFVSGIETGPDNLEITRAVVALAHSLGLDATGEGVESAAQLDALERIGCDHAQGFHLGRPVPHESVPALLGDPAPSSGKSGTSLLARPVPPVPPVHGAAADM